MDALTHQNGIRLRVSSQRSAIAPSRPDLRGYGESSRPDASDAYTQLHIVGDLIGLVDALAERSCVLVGHDWGAVAT